MPTLLFMCVALKTQSNSQVVYLINQLTKPGAHPQIYITADGGAAPVPLPAAVWLFGGALAGLGLAGRRQTAR